MRSSETAAELTERAAEALAQHTTACVVATHLCWIRGAVLPPARGAAALVGM